MASRAAPCNFCDPDLDDRDDCDDREVAGGGIRTMGGGEHGTFTLLGMESEHSIGDGEHGTLTLWQPLGCLIRDFCTGVFGVRALVLSQLAKLVPLHVLKCRGPGAGDRGLLCLVSPGTPTV